jgi:putative ABC transport system permease protein
VQILMLVVTVVVVVAAGASVAGTMGTTIVERSREIGLLKAMGGTRRQVLFLFAVEAATLGAIGGLAGFLAGWGLAAVAAKTVFGAASGFMPGFLPLALLVALGLAMAGSLGPLIAVFRLDPAASLRGE